MLYYRALTLLSLAPTGEAHWSGEIPRPPGPGGCRGQRLKVKVMQDTHHQAQGQRRHKSWWKPPPKAKPSQVAPAEKLPYSVRRFILRSHELLKSEVGSLNHCITSKFDRCLSSGVAETRVNFQSNQMISNTNLTVLEISKIFQRLESNHIHIQSYGMKILIHALTAC